jgi:hypothetical protein
MDKRKRRILEKVKKERKPPAGEKKSQDKRLKRRSDETISDLFSSMNSS